MPLRLRLTEPITTHIDMDIIVIHHKIEEEEETGYPKH